MESSELPVTTNTKLKRIAQLSASDPEKVFDNLMHLFNVESLGECFRGLDGRKAVGIDGITKAQYGEELGRNLQDLVARMNRMSYRPEAVRQVLIPKEGKPGATRPLGISNMEDKIVQRMTQSVLESIFEPLFYPCSYGFRPGLGCHDAIKALRNHLYSNDVQVVIDVDLANFFGTIDHTLLESLISQKIQDKKFIRYIRRMFKAGVLVDGELSLSDEGVPQGSICSPVMANVVGHYVIDQWFQETVKAFCRGKVEMFRYADDIVICCQFDHDAERIKKALRRRLEKYRLKLNEEKTHCVPFSKIAYSRDAKQGVFDFLGFTFYLGRTRRGGVVPKLKTSKKRFRSKLKNVTDWARHNRNRFKLKLIWRTFCSKLEGHIRYYGVSFNSYWVQRFVSLATETLFKWLNRRSQRKSFSWDQFQLFMKAYPLPKARICYALF